MNCDKKEREDIDMNLYHLRYFAELAHTEHYTKAAEKLCITQPSLSHAIRELEGELGLPLFEKNGRNTNLTRFGKEFLSCVENSLSVLDSGVEQMKRIARGEGLIRLGLLRSVGVEYIPKLASAFLASKPDKDIRFEFHTGVTKALVEGLLSRKYDLIFCSRPQEELGLTAVPVEKQDLVLITPKKHPLSNRISVNLEDTVCYPYVYFAKGSGLRNVVENLFGKIQKKPVVAYETEEDQVIAGLVAQGFGIAIVPYMEILERLYVSILQIDNPRWERNIYMIKDDRTFTAPAVMEFFRFALNSCIH